MATVAFLPGLPLSSAQFDASVRALAGEHRVVLIGYPGFGDRALQTNLDVAGHVADTRAQLAAASPGPYVLVGLSFGAQLALAIAREDPSAVDALVLSNTQGRPPNEQERGMFLEAASAAEAHGSGALVEMLTGMLLSTATRESRTDVVDAFGSLVAASPGEATASGFRAFAGRPDPATGLAKLDVPVLLLWGGNDQAAPLAEADTLDAAIPRASCVTIDDAGHLAPMETPKAYSDALRTFVAAL